MIRFVYPIYFLLLLIIPVMLLFRYGMYLWEKRKLKRLGDKELLEQMMPALSKKRPTVKFLLLMAAIALVVCIMARPQVGSKIQNDTRNGIEIMIAVDISNSMKAEDVSPSRLDKTKMLVENMIDKFPNDKVGIVVFAGDAFVQMPMTKDYISAKMFLRQMDPSQIQLQGTNIAEAIRLSSGCFSQNKIGKAIVVITDGEDHEGGASEAAREAHALGMNVFILGVGSKNGAPVPDVKEGYLTDEYGEKVITKLNEDMCKEIAKAGEGQYIHVDNTSEAQEILNDQLAKLQRGETQNVIYSEYDEQFQAVCLILLLVLIIEICITEAKNPLFRNITIFKKRNKK